MPEVTGAATHETATDVVVGIDIGGTGTRFVAFEPATIGCWPKRMHPTLAGVSREEAQVFLRRHVEGVVSGRRPAAIGIGAAGPSTAPGSSTTPTRCLPSLDGT